MIRKTNRIYLYKPKFKIYKKTWVFHKCDADPYPSVPHGHAIDDNELKLRIWDGAIYKNKRIIGYAKSTEMNRLQEDVNFQAFVNEQQEWYKQNFLIEPIVYPLKVSKRSYGRLSKNRIRMISEKTNDVILVSLTCTIDSRITERKHSRTLIAGRRTKGKKYN